MGSRNPHLMHYKLGLLRDLVFRVCSYAKDESLGLGPVRESDYRNVVVATDSIWATFRDPVYQELYNLT